MTISISPKWQDHLQVAPLTPWWPKLELKIFPHLAQSIDSELTDRFWCSRCLNDCINLPHMIGSLPSGTTSSLMAKNWTKNLSQLFKELQGSNLEFKLTTPKHISRTYFSQLSKYIRLDRSIQSFRHLEHQNPSIIWGYIGRASEM